MSSTNLIYCSKGTAEVSNIKDGTFLNEVSDGIIVDIGDEVSVEQVCINSVGIGGGTLEIPTQIKNYPYDPTTVTFNMWYYIHQNFRYTCNLPMGNMTTATDIVTVETQDDYGYVSDTYTYPALPIKTTFKSKSPFMQLTAGTRMYVGGWVSDPDDLKAGVPEKTVGANRTFPTQTGCCWNCIEGNINVSIDQGYDSPSNIAEKITEDFHAANAATQVFAFQTGNNIDSGLVDNTIVQYPQFAVAEDNTCSIILPSIPESYYSPTGYNFYGSYFTTTNPNYLYWGSRLLSANPNAPDFATGNKSNSYMDNRLGPNPAHENDIYNLYSLPFDNGPPLRVTIPDNYILPTTLPFNENALRNLLPFMKTQGQLRGRQRNNTNGLETYDTKQDFEMPFTFGRSDDRAATDLTPLQSPVQDPATHPSSILYGLKSKVYFDENAYSNVVLPDIMGINDDAFIDMGALISWEGQDYTALDLCRKLDLGIACVNTGALFGSNELVVAFIMKPSSNIVTQPAFYGNYCLVSLSQYNPLCTTAVLSNPDIVKGGADTTLADYANKLQVGSPNLNMTFDSVRERFGISNMSWGRYIDNGNSTSANGSAGQQVITANYDPAVTPLFVNPSQPLKPYTNYAQSGVGLVTVSVLDYNDVAYRIDPFDEKDIAEKYNNSLLRRLGFTFRQLANYRGNPISWFNQKTYEAVKKVTYPTSFPYPLTNNYKMETALNIALSVNDSNLPMFNLSTERLYTNINISAETDTCYATQLPIKLVTPFYLIKSDIFEGEVLFNSENNGATESIMLVCNKAYTSGDYAYSFGTQYSFKATKSFVINAIKTAILKPDLTPADIDDGTAVIYKVTKPNKYFQELEAEQQSEENKDGKGKK